MKNKISRKEFIQLSLMGLTLPVMGIACSSEKKNPDTGILADSISSPATTTITNPFSNRLGIQLYSVRDAFKENPGETLKKVAGVGFKELELANINDLTHLPIIKDLGMEVKSIHFSGDPVKNLWKPNSSTASTAPAFEEMVEICAKNDVPYLVIAIFRPENETLEDYKSFAEMANKAGEKAKAAGVQLCYHNHSFELATIDNTTPLDAMNSIFDKELVKLELDLFWVKVSGNDPVALMRKYSDRVSLLHLKDVMKGAPENRTTFGIDPSTFQPVGDGSIDFKAVLTTAHEIGVKHTFVEQDQSTERDIFESIDRSYQYLQTLAL